MEEKRNVRAAERGFCFEMRSLGSRVKERLLKMVWRWIKISHTLCVCMCVCARVFAHTHVHFVDRSSYSPGLFQTHYVVENNIDFLFTTFILSHITSWLQFPLPSPLLVSPPTCPKSIPPPFSFTKSAGFSGISTIHSLIRYNNTRHKASYQGQGDPLEEKGSTPRQKSKRATPIVGNPAGTPSYTTIRPMQRI